MNLTKTMCLLLAYVAASSLYGNAVEWEGLMREHRPRLPAKETRSLPTLRAAAAVRNGNGDEAAVAIRAAAKRALGAALPDAAVFENAFRTDEERIDVAEFMSGGVRNRIAVYGQLGNFEPYYRIVDGLAASAPSGMADFLARNCVVGGNACVSAVDGVLAADEVVIRGGRGETLSAPYARFYFVFVDDGMCSSPRTARPSRSSTSCGVRGSPSRRPGSASACRLSAKSRKSTRRPLRRSGNPSTTMRRDSKGTASAMPRATSRRRISC